jgi:hypothetical protein
VVSPSDWLVSTVWFLLSTRLVVIVRLGKTATHARWSELLYSPGSSCVALHLQLYLVSFSPARWGNSGLNAALYLRDQLWGPPPALLWEVGLSPQPCSQPLWFPDLYWVLSALLGGWLFIPLPLPTSSGCQWLLWEVDLSPCSDS